jgi:uncharacterized membrane protein YgdD (TMEM256/DUF423 family)
MANPWFRLAAVLMMLGVMLGSFGAHGLKGRLSPESFKTYQIGVFYQYLHAGALFIVSWANQSGSTRASYAGIAFTLGILLFSGSLYLLSLTGQKWLGAITPLGGVAFIIGWGILASGK